MSKMMIALVATLSLAACKKGGGANDSIAKMEGFQKAMCECKDKACADKVQDDMTKWGTEMAKTAKPADDKPDPEMVKKSGEIMTKYTECMTKLMTAAMTPPKTDTPKTTEEPKKDEPAVKADDTKKDEPTKADDTKKDEPKKDDTKKDTKKPDDKKAGGW
jgi:hypothetical protein